MTGAVQECVATTERDRELADRLGVGWLACGGCGREFPVTWNEACRYCGSDLDLVYDYGAIRSSLTAPVDRPRSLWRYSFLLPVPVSSPPRSDVGWTTLREVTSHAPYCARLWIKEEGGPSGGSHVRGGEVARAAALELCRGNAGTARSGRGERGVFHREGVKTVAFEIAEQLGWRAPDVVLAPRAATPAIERGFWELQKVGLIGADQRPRLIRAEGGGGLAGVDASIREALSGSGRRSVGLEVVVVDECGLLLQPGLP